MKENGYYRGYLDIFSLLREKIIPISEMATNWDTCFYFYYCYLINAIAITVLIWHIDFSGGGHH